jgi:hypothetical protein
VIQERLNDGVATVRVVASKEVQAGSCEKTRSAVVSEGKSEERAVFKQVKQLERRVIMQEIALTKLD